MKVTIPKKHRIFLYPEHELFTTLEAQAKARRISVNQHCTNLLIRGLLAEDISVVREEVQEIVTNLKSDAAMARRERLVILEMLGYLRMLVADSNPENVERAKAFALKTISKMEEGNEG